MATTSNEERPDVISQVIARRHDSRAWGSAYLEADEDAPDVPGFQMAADFPKVPSRIHSAWYRLAQETCDGSVTSVDSGSEVGIVLARDVATLREWRAFVPRQSVGGTHVALRMDALIDLITGEECEGLPEGWRQAGTSHSHNTMRAFFSRTDDEDELSIPGLHYVLGSLDNAKAYGWAVSIVLRGVRHELDDIRRVVDVAAGAGRFHGKCLDYITRERTAPVVLPERTYHAFNGSDEDVDWSRVFAKYDDERKTRRGPETLPRFRDKDAPSARDVRYDRDDDRRMAIHVARHHASMLVDKRQRRAVLALADACESLTVTDAATRGVLWDLMLTCLDDSEMWR